MTKYFVIYHAPASVMEKTKDKSPAEMQADMKPWMDWAAKIGDGLVDFGSPLGNGQKVTKDGSETSDKEVAGYSIIQADSIDAATAMLKDHPHLAWAEGCDIEVHEMMPMPVPVS